MSCASVTISRFFAVFFFIDTATTEIYTYFHTLSLHDALPIYAFAHNFQVAEDHRQQVIEVMGDATGELADGLQFLRLEQRFASLLQGLLRAGDRKSTRLNSSH